MEDAFEVTILERHKTHRTLRFEVEVILANRNLVCPKGPRDLDSTGDIISAGVIVLRVELRPKIVLTNPFKSSHQGRQGEMLAKEIEPDS